MPVTALVGPRGSGKSRLLAATAWLPSGEPRLAGSAAGAAGPVVSAELSDGDTSRTIEAVAGIRSHVDKVLKAWRRFHDRPADEIPEQFRRIVETTVRLASAENPA